MAHRAQPHSRLPLLAALVVIAAAVAAGLVIILRLTDSGGAAVSPVTRRYTEGVAGSWQRINPLFSTANEVDQDLVALVFAGLTRLGPSGEVLPGLAELPQVSSDERTYTFALKPNLQWQDGTPVTSADVTFTIERLRAPDFKGDPNLAAAWEGIEVTANDERTVTFRLPQASAPFLARNTTLPLLPSHLLAGLTSAQLFEAPFNSAPIGTGPYRLVSITSSEARFEANPRYHLGTPHAQTLVIRFYADYPAALRAFEAGEIDGLMLRDPMTDAQATTVADIGGVEIVQPQRAAYLLLYLNNDRVDIFQDDRVRRAISLGIDRQVIVDTVFSGSATASSSPVAPASWAYDPQYDQVELRREEAAALLDEAGWIPHPTTGIRIRQGAEFRITIRTDNNPVRVAVAGEIAHQLEALGIRATVASTTFSVLRRDFLQERRYEAAIAGWDQGPDPDPYFGWHSSQMGTAGLNIANFSDSVADTLIEKGRTSAALSLRTDMYRQFQEVWEDVQPSVVIAYPRYTYLFRGSVKASVPSLLITPAQRFADIHLWDV
jgi:peptide/nickel transport system substrate-binding protein